MNEVALAAGLAWLIGAVVGSFLATLAIRWPAGRSIARGRSACDGCHRPLRWWELIPIASYAIARGDCRRCGAPIDKRHVLMEMGCAWIGCVALLVAPGWTGWCGALFGWGLAVLAVLDVDHFWLPDALTLPLLALGLAAGGFGVSPSLMDRAIGAVAGWAVLAALAFLYRHARRRIGLGQGDAKLLGAIGAWLGWMPLPWVVLGACVIGLILAVVRRMRRDDRLPLGTLLAASGWVGWLALMIW